MKSARLGHVHRHWVHLRVGPGGSFAAIGKASMPGEQSDRFSKRSDNKRGCATTLLLLPSGRLPTRSSSCQEALSTHGPITARTPARFESSAGTEPSQPSSSFKSFVAAGRKVEGGRIKCRTGISFVAILFQPAQE